jgi:hypothetical protein
MRREAALIALAATAVAGCGGTERTSRPANAPPSTPADLAVPIHDAGAARDAIVRTVLGRATVDDPTAALVALYPQVRFGSERTSADARGVSVWWTPRDQYTPEQPGNPTLLVVAVRDAQGTCAVGAASGVGTFRDGLIARGDEGDCTAEGARGALGLDGP